jgi:hypothetical protein
MARKVRVIEFNPRDPQSRDRFCILHQAILGAQDVKGIHTLRRIIGLLDRFDALSDPVDGDANLRRLAREGRLLLERDEYELVKRCLEEGRWNAAASREILKLYDLVCELHEVEPDTAPPADR